MTGVQTCALPIYMLLRSQRSASYWKAHHRDGAQVTAVHLAPKTIEDAGDGAELSLIMNVPNLFMIRMPMDDGTTSYRLAVAGDPDGPWASVDSGPTGEITVTQYGDRRLWDEVEAAFTWWRDRGSPGPERFGLLVTEDGTQIWLDEPPIPT